MYPTGPKITTSKHHSKRLNGCNGESGILSQKQIFNPTETSYETVLNIVIPYYARGPS